FEGGFGSAITILSFDSDIETTALRARVRVLTLFLDGLARHIESNEPAARELFDQAIVAAGDETAGLEVVYMFAGNAALNQVSESLPYEEQVRLYTAALDYYTLALALRPNYARALNGRGAVLSQLGRINFNRGAPAITLPEDALCLYEPTPTTSQDLALLSERCFEAALVSPDQPEGGDIDLKSRFGLGQLYLWTAIYGVVESRWDDAACTFVEVIALYDASADNAARQVRTMWNAGQAHGNLGYILTQQQPANLDAQARARYHYGEAIRLLEADVYRARNVDAVTAYRRLMSDIPVGGDPNAVTDCPA
ncbi:MAG: hypothetical protein SGI73_23240, partial [Chloroflexota bacterium]|nr:hypothetical protein [Chloroflexota bacterium]